MTIRLSLLTIIALVVVGGVIRRLLHNETIAVSLFFDPIGKKLLRPMIEPVTINLNILSRDLGLPQEQVQTVVRLLDEGYPVPFIARYRKDVTGNLDEENVRFIASKLRHARSLAERKQAILKAIDALGGLPPECDKKIRESQTLKQLEDLYLPYKPKKQTPANIARERGLTELATEILEENVTPEKLDERAAAFINEDKNIKSAADALLGAGYIIAETFAEKTDLIQKIRDLLRSDGKLVTKKTDQKDTQTNSTKNKPQTDNSTKQDKITETESAESNQIDESETKSEVDKKSDADIIVTNNNDDNVKAEVEAKVDADADAKVEVEVEVVDGGTKESNVAETDGGVDEVVAEVETETTGIAVDLKTEESVAVAAEVVADVKPVDDANEITEQFLELRGAIVGEGITTAKSKLAAGKKKKQQKVKDDSKQRREDLKTKEREHFERQFADFFDSVCNAGDIPPQRILAFNRGEREKVLRVTIEIDEGKVFDDVRDLFVPQDHKFSDFLSGCLKDAIHRFLIPSLVRELRADMTDYAEGYVVRLLARNLRSLLLQPPLNQKRVLAIEPGFKRGCKVVPIDEFGNVLGHETVYLSGGSERKTNSIKKLADIVERYKIPVIAIGNGINYKETEIAVSKLIADYFADKDMSYVIVNETGAGAYAMSNVAREEFPNYDSSVRVAISVGRRLQNSLNELVKTDAEHLGVGVYQHHDVKVKRLRESLNEVIESCVNFVGVDVNSATPSLLRYVAGLNKFTARRIYDYRLENGHFHSRDEFLKISGIGGSTFTGCAGFLRIYGGANPLDATWIHPENYHVAVSLIEKFGFNLEDLKSAAKRRELASKIGEENIQEFANKHSVEFGIGVNTLADILTELTQWGSDPRESLPKPIFKKGVLKFEDLRVGMELVGAASNVVEFGVFVDVGLHDPGLVHISQISDRYIRNAHDKVAVGDIVRVWVTELDEKRRRISLTMLPPGTVKEQKRGNVANDAETVTATTSDSDKERKQYTYQRREPRTRNDLPNRSNDNNMIRTTEKAAGKPIGGRPERTGFTRGGQVGQSSQDGRKGQFVARGQRDQLDQKTNARPQSGSPIAGRADKPFAAQQNSSTRSFVSGQNDRRDGDRNRDRGLDRTSRFNRGDRGDRAVDAGEKRPKTYVATPVPKELKPITDKMKLGKEPLRSFGDLAQLWGRVQVAETTDTKKQKKEPQKINEIENEIKIEVKNENEQVVTESAAE
ncbi:MAG: helix-hairpin-helix domain-containing protein [Planctomycetaceae bacterium]|nr:helix-hairpin-helix domain-containing protein [Planctomycetaceae bacterium]